MMKKLIILGLALIFCASMVACGGGDTSNGNAEEAAPRNIYNDENVSVDFVKISNSILEGNFEFYIKAQNKTDKDITVYLKDVTINNSVVQIGSGVPCDIIAGANRTHG